MIELSCKDKKVRMKGWRGCGLYSVVKIDNDGVWVQYDHNHIGKFKFEEVEFID